MTLYVMIISYFLLFISAPCNCFLLPFLYQRFSTPVKRTLVLIGDCDKFIDHQNQMWKDSCLYCVQCDLCPFIFRTFLYLVFVLVLSAVYCM
jgi:hypothetical protein